MGKGQREIFKPDRTSLQCRCKTPGANQESKEKDVGGDPWHLLGKENEYMLCIVIKGRHANSLRWWAQMKGVIMDNGALLRSTDAALYDRQQFCFNQPDVSRSNLSALVLLEELRTQVLGTPIRFHVCFLTCFYMNHWCVDSLSSNSRHVCVHPIFSQISKATDAKDNGTWIWIDGFSRHLFQREPQFFFNTIPVLLPPSIGKWVSVGLKALFCVWCLTDGWREIRPSLYVPLTTYSVLCSLMFGSSLPGWVKLIHYGDGEENKGAIHSAV